MSKTNKLKYTVLPRTVGNSDSYRKARFINSKIESYVSSRFFANVLTKCTAI